MTDLFDHGARTAYQIYVERLSAAIKFRDWISDPSFALKSDAQIYTKVLRDPVTAHAIRFRKHLVAGAGVRVEAASDRAEDRAAADIVDELLNQIQGFTDSRINLAEAIFRGSAYATVVGRRKFMRAGTLVGGKDAPPREWWCPERLKDVDRRRFRLVRDFHTSVLSWEFWSVERQEWERMTNPEWFVRSVYENTEDSLEHGRGLLDTLYYFQASKARALQDAMRASERFGQGLIKVAIDNLRGADGNPVGGSGRGGDDIASQWQTTMAKHHARGVLVHDARDEVSILSGIGEGRELLEWVLSYLDNAQVTTVLGATLPTIEGDGGSRAMALVQENSTEALIQADRARLADDLTRDLVGLIWRLNRAAIKAQVGDAVMPRLRIDQRKHEDPLEAAQVIASLLASGVELKREEVYEKTNFTAPLPGDDTIGGLSQPADATIAGGLDLDPLSDSGAEDGGVVADETPVAVQDNQPVSEDAMNGAQIASLMEIVLNVASGVLPLESAVAMIPLAFPTITSERARAMLAPAAEAPIAPTVEPLAGDEAAAPSNGGGELPALAARLKP